MMAVSDGWNPLKVDQTGNCWEWEYRDGTGTRIIVEPAAHAYIVGLQNQLAALWEKVQTANGTVTYEPIKGWLGIEDARDGHVVVLTQDVFDVVRGEPFPVFRRQVHIARAEVGQDDEADLDGSAGDGDR